MRASADCSRRAKHLENNDGCDGPAMPTSCLSLHTILPIHHLVQRRQRRTLSKARGSKMVKAPTSGTPSSLILKIEMATPPNKPAITLSRRGGPRSHRRARRERLPLSVSWARIPPPAQAQSTKPIDFYNKLID